MRVRTPFVFVGVAANLKQPSTRQPQYSTSTEKEPTGNWRQKTIRAGSYSLTKFCAACYVRHSDALHHNQ